MKQLLTAAAVASGVASPILATPTDAIVFGTLICTMAVGAALIGNAIFGDAARAGVTSRASLVSLRVNRKSSALGLGNG
jgi:hypothetical protein